MFAWTYMCVRRLLSLLLFLSRYEGRQWDEAREDVSDSHVLELGHVSQACCVRIS